LVLRYPCGQKIFIDQGIEKKDSADEEKDARDYRKQGGRVMKSNLINIDAP